MIEEYARLNGHPDRLRDRIDGATGVSEPERLTPVNRSARRVYTQEYAPTGATGSIRNRRSKLGFRRCGCSRLSATVGDRAVS